MFTRLVYHASLATSPHNNQAWLFRFSANGTRVDVLIDRNRLLPALDPDHRETYVGLGGAIENLCLAARQEGLDPVVRLFPEGAGGDEVADVHLRPGPPATQEEKALFRAIPQRATNRRFYERRPIAADVLDQMTDTARTCGARLRVVSEPNRIAALAKLVGQGERVRYEHPAISREAHHWMRFSRQHAEQTRDGLWSKTFGLDPVSEVGSQMLLRWETLRLLNPIGASRMLGKRAEQEFRASGAIALLTMPLRSPSAYVEGGRIFQRIALHATLAGAWIHPVSSVPELSMLREDHPDMLPAAHHETVRRMQSQVHHQLGVSATEGYVMFFRMGYAPPPIYRSPRRPPAEIMIPAGEVSRDGRAAGAASCHD